MTRRRPLDLPDPGKPLAEMTGDERSAYLRQLRRALRDDQVRRGARAPRTMRETEIWLEELEKRDGQRTLRVERGRRRGVDRAEAFEGLPMAEALEAESDLGQAKREQDDGGGVS